MNLNVLLMRTFKRIIYGINSNLIDEAQGGINMLGEKVT